MTTTEWALTAEALALTSLLIYSIIISFKEKESAAALKLATALFVSILLFSAILLFQFPFKETVQFAVLGVSVLCIAVLSFPIAYKKEKPQQPEGRFDERDVMFSRFKLQPDTERFEQYYATRPKKLASDNRTRKQAGLLSDKAKYYHPVLFKAAHANFFAVDALAPAINGRVAATVSDVDPKEITQYLKEWIKRIGGHSVGVTLLHDHHLYTHKGRGERYGQKLTRQHRYAIAFTVEMDFENVAAAPAAPIVFESSMQYLNAGNIAVQVAAFIRDMGYAAQAHIDGNYEVICPLVARDAGLGEIGRMGLLMEKTLGPRCRIGVITTDLPLETDVYEPDTSVIRFCERCMKCADTCPGKAISKNDREGEEDNLRWRIDHDACFYFWNIAGTDCGRCMAVCPYSHPDNLLHNVVRCGIRYSPVFGRIALFLDDVLYGRRPKPKGIPKWVDRGG